jgi:hypothetical protein
MHLIQHQIQTKLTHPAVWTSRPTKPTSFFFHSTFSVRQVTLTVPTTHIHTKLSEFRHLAYLLVSMRETLSYIVLLEIGFKKGKIAEILGFTIRNCGIMVANNTNNTTELAMQHPICTLLITHLQQTEILSTHIPEIWTLPMFINH